MPPFSLSSTRRPGSSTAAVLLATLFLLISAGCGSPVPQEAAVSESEEAVTLVEAAAITDTAYLTGDTWNDGQAEVAFYEVERTRNQYGREVEQQFLVGTYLVKHLFDSALQSKVNERTPESTSAFKYAFFYEFESGAYQYKRSHVVNAAQRDLRPLKASLAMFDWCSNTYRELAFLPDGAVDRLTRTDDYGNDTGRFDYQSNAYPVALLPLLVRALDFSESESLPFSVVLQDGAYIPVVAERVGTETVETEAGVFDTERIELRYEAEAPSLIGEGADASEIYWRGTGPDRLLIRFEGASGRYRMVLKEHLRSAYWRENFYPSLARVAARP